MLKYLKRDLQNKIRISGKQFLHFRRKEIWNRNYTALSDSNDIIDGQLRVAEIMIWLLFLHSCNEYSFRWLCQIGDWSNQPAYFPPQRTQNSGK